MKSRKGITLIALVITIIVLLILAGVSISLVVGNNGVLTQATNAVNQNRKATAKEEVQMAWASATSEYWSDWANNSGVNKSNYFTAQNLTKYVEETGEILKSEPMEDRTYHIKYESKDQGKKYDFRIDEDGNISELVFTDVAEIGDYVDIGINYENQHDTYNGLSSSYSGWRVLSIKNDNGKKYIDLISAGSPIVYYFGNRNAENKSTVLNDCSDLFVEISPSTNYQTQRKAGFHSNGFASNDLTSSSVFGNKEVIDYTKKIHPVTTQEIIIAYNEITNLSKTEAQLMTNNVFLDSNMGLSSGDKAYQLIDNGTRYWTNTFTIDDSNASLIGVFPDNHCLGGSYDNGYCWRPVVSLLSDVKIADDNTGDGSSSTSAYKITK